MPTPAALMYERHTPMLVKVATLAAAGRPGSLPYLKLVVTLADVECALAALTRWERFATTFVKSLNATEHERLIQRCADMARKRGAVPRKVVARDIHIPKRQLDDIEAALIDRGTITAKGEDGIKVWRWAGGNG